jgi:hypothetical protein
VVIKGTSHFFEAPNVICDDEDALDLDGRFWLGLFFLFLNRDLGLFLLDEFRWVFLGSIRLGHLGRDRALRLLN